MYFSKHIQSFLSDIYLRLQLLDHSGDLYGDLGDTSKSFPKCFCQFILLAAYISSSYCFRSSSYLGNASLFQFSRSSGSIVKTSCDFICSFLMSKDAEYFFIYACFVAHLFVIWVSSFMNCPFESFARFNWVSCFLLLICSNSYYVEYDFFVRSFYSKYSLGVCNLVS